MFKLRDARKKHTRRAFAPLAAVAMVMLAVTAVFAAPTVAQANPLADAWNGIVSFFAGDAGVEPAAAGDVTKEADNSSIATREGVAKDNTENIGRIWTDKTVNTDTFTLPTSSQGKTHTIDIGNSDFLVTLSALSSASNTVASSSKPLDIVLVMDASGSMDDPLSGRTTRIEALQEAANSFVEAIAKKNASISDASKQHQVSLVKFAGNKTDKVGNDFETTPIIPIPTANYTQVMRTLSPCTDATLSSFTSLINAIRPLGGTESGNGMDLAVSQLSSSAARSDAQKVVIFFTDGEPGNGSSFDGKVANQAVTASHGLKEDKALVYSVGIFNGANPNGTSNANKFMNAVSSNYPDATAYNQLGDRDPEGNYYKTATTAEELKNIFTEIQEEIGQKAQFPTETTDGAAGTSGYITFTDTLGKYMHVDSFKPIVFADEEFTVKDKQTNDNVDTYIYEGEVSGSALYPDGNVSQILITVTRSDDMSTGDTVEVKIPAGLIPLRYFDVDSKDASNPTMTIKEAYPIRITYGVSVKPGVLEPILDEDDSVKQPALIYSPDTAMSDYLKKNTADGKAQFYSNLYSKKTSLANETIGDTVASFTPASGNSFYYFTADTQLFHDKEMNDPVEGNETIQDGVTYYYNRPYWQKGEGNKADYIAKNPVAIDAESGLSENHLKTDGEGVKCIIGGTQHISRIYSLHLKKTDVPETGKGSNVTGTAETVVNPDWVANTHNINVALGNNGRLSAEVPGTLEISKKTIIPSGFDTNLGNTSFEMVVTSRDMAGKRVDAVVKNAKGEIQGKYFKLEFGSDGVAKHAIKNGETLYVYGMTAGASYTVAETNVEGFKQTDANGNTGNIAASASSKVSFENTYEAKPIEVPAASIFTGTKVLADRDWMESDSFTFTMEADGAPANEVLQNARKQTVAAKDVAQGSDRATFNFGEMTFKKPGTYKFNIYEVKDDCNSATGGMSYSDALYSVSVEIKDDLKGNLSLGDVTLTQVSDDKGTHTETVVSNATFTNTYSTASVHASLTGTKHYEDKSADKPNDGTMFKVRVTALDGGPLPAGANNGQYDATVPAGNPDASISFGQATFTAAMVGHTYTYEVKELVKVGNEWLPVTEAITDPVNGKYVLDGMTYDHNVYTVSVYVDEVAGSDGSSAIHPVVTYPNNAKQLDFYNVYEPTPLVLGDDTNNAIKGTKTLTGRSMLENETFDFTLSATSEVVSGGYTIANGKASISGAGEGVAKEFSFGDVTFTKPGTYVFDIDETGHNGSEELPKDGTDGLKFDRHTCTVTVKVVDDNGTLKLADKEGIVYSDGAMAAFKNSYTAKLDLTNGVKVSKTLTGRDMKAGEKFTFTVAAAEGDDAAAKKLAKTDGSFEVAGAKNDTPVVKTALSNLKFDQNDVNTTFNFVITEDAPDENPSNGVTYNVDKREYKVAISIVDNGNGTLKANTVITDAKDTHVWTGDLAATAMTNEQALPFTNSYQAKPATSFAEGRFGGNKVLSGRDWLDTDSFIFTLTGGNNAPMPENTSVKLTAADVKADHENTLKDTDGVSFQFNFGKITYSTVGEYDYTIEEQGKGTEANGIKYSDNTLKLHVLVTDPGDGQLVAKVTRTSAAGTRTFTNTYSAGIDSYGTAANVAVTKQLKNRDWTKDQFTFIAKPADQDSATKVGRDNTDEFELDVKNGGAANEVVEILNLDDLQFKQNESGKTYSYTFKEKDGKAAGYTYDGTTYQLDITPHDLGNGKMSVTTKVTTKPAEGEEKVQENTWSQGDPVDFKIAFVNTYEAKTSDNDGAVKVEATKELTGRALKDNDFTFAIAPSGKMDGKNDIVTAQNKADGTIKFPAINYKASELNALANQDNSYVVKKGNTWTVSYTAYEKEPAKDSGITQEKKSFDFTVTVKDDGDGTLSTTLNLPTGDDATTFKNVYGEGASATATVSATKTLIGRPQKDDEFTFTVTPKVDNPQAEDIKTGKSTAGADGTPTGIDFDSKSDGVQGVQLLYTFDSLNQAVKDGYATYEKDSKTWTVNYVMSEDTQLPAGVTVTKDTHATQEFSVQVKDNENGTLTVVKEPAALEFSNTYSASIQGGDVTLNSQIKKKFEGRTWKESDEFTFEITSVNGGPLPSGVTETADNKGTVTIKGNGKDAEQFVQFGTIPFTFKDIEKEPVGTDGKRTKEFIYTVTEVVPEGASDNVKDGITYDTHTATITVTLTDNGDGTMSGETNIKDGADQGGAQLMAFVKDVDANVFTNVYKSELDYNANGKGGLTINKTLTGRDMTAGQFQFEVKKTQGDDDRLDIEGTYASKDAKNGKPSVVVTAKDGVKFTNEDAGKTWEYTISEVTDGKPENKGYTYDKTIYTVTVSVKDNGNSTLTVTTTVTDGKGGKKDYIYTTGQTPTEAAVVNFNNTYSAVPEYLGGEGKVSLEATKTLTGRDMKAGEFGFTVYNNKGEEVATGANAAAADGQKGEITFTPIKYTSESLYKDAAERKATASEPDKDGKITYTYTYTVKETSGVVDGVAASKSEFTVTVKVTDNNDGSLSIKVEQPTDGMAFTNTYGEGENGKATVSLSGQKQYNTPASSNAPDIADKFTFKLTGSEGAPMPEKTTTTNDASGNVNFGAIEYTMKNVWPASADETQAGAEDKGVAPAKSEERTKTFDYTVSESGSVPGVTNDATSKTFHVTVKDDGQGNLTVECTDAAGNKVDAGAFKFAFVNTYSTTPVTTDAKTSIGGTKELKVPEWSERKLAAGEFNFTLAPVTEGAPMPKNATVTNDADGNFTFGSMTFEKRGTYEYKLTEDKGADASVTYDGSVYTVTVKVEDNGAGALVIESVTYTKNGEPADTAAFVNEYTVDKAGAMLALGAKKDLVGRELKEGEFKFALTYNTAKGESTVTAANAADGSVTFPEIPFTKPGTYTFTMNEVAGSDKTITYDGTEYEATVTVTEKNADGVYDGKLHASVAYEDGAVPVFKNTYTKPADPKPAPKPEEPKAPTLPQTGDTSALPVVVAAVAGVACIGGGLALSRRRK